MRTFFTFMFMLLITVPVGMLIFGGLDAPRWIQFGIGLFVGLIGANIANVVFDAFIKPWFEDDGN